MGCGTSKVLPEHPKNIQLDLVKKVEPYLMPKSDQYKHFITDYGRIETKGGSPTTPYPCGNQHGHSETADPRRHKVAKYRAKFDQRVTAKYDIKALIGRGSFSRVVRVEHKASKQPYAIKMIETKYREGREVCESELNVLRRVRHTNIIQLIEVFETQERVYMVMELATGGELFDRIIAKGSFTERDATHVLQMVLEGVKYLHTLGITHRDLKPENLLYYHPGTDSKIMITDFGLASARKKGDDCLMKTTCGTPEYIAPEILPWPSVSNLAKDFIDRLLMVEPSERMTASQALKHPWIVSMAASSSMKNLHRSISQNLLKRASSRCQSTKSAQSVRSSRSNKSTKSRRVRERELRELNLRYQQQYYG
ncbi:serine/threonine-protein kinase H1 isoform X2 [Rana temporaria]|uniref:serine/threonine-protein kinase H1 isoform X2 n=1 Tax=Rana temporaria TaxID=8407 RepID=UPI001AAD81E6|nr:serine/threonine-protein kinase H1 isoform X2 [Rana temporaria]